MRITLSGITSFTGCHIARELRSGGHDILAFLTRPRETYTGELVRRRFVSGFVRQRGKISRDSFFPACVAEARDGNRENPARRRFELEAI